jgi:hypothetical protein
LSFVARASQWNLDNLVGAGHDIGLGLAVATLLSATQRCLASWCIRRSRFLLMGTALFLLSLFTIISQLLLVRWVGQLNSLVWGYVFALAVQCACLATLFRGADGGHWGRIVSARGLRVVARRYSRFPKYMVGYALASSSRDRLVQIALGIGAGASAVGRFGLAYRVIFAPNSLIYSAVSPIFFGMASRNSRAVVGRFAAGLVESIYVMLIVPYLAFAIEAPSLTDEVLSEKWRGTGSFFRALAAPALLLAATCWLDRAFDSFRRQRAAFALEASFTVTSIALVAYLATRVDALSVAWAFATLGVIYYWTYLTTTFVACGFPMADFKHACMTGLLATGLTLGLCILAHQLPQLSLRVACYALLMLALCVGWLRFRGGFGILRTLMQFRVGSHINDSPTAQA